MGYYKIVGMHGILQNSRHAWDMELLYNCLEPLSSITIEVCLFQGLQEGLSESVLFREVSSKGRGVSVVASTSYIYLQGVCPHSPPCMC